MIQELLTRLRDRGFDVVRCGHGYLRLSEKDIADFKPEEEPTVTSDYVQIRARDEHHTPLLLKLYKDGRCEVMRDAAIRFKQDKKEERIPLR